MYKIAPKLKYLKPGEDLESLRKKSPKKINWEKLKPILASLRKEREYYSKLADKEAKRRTLHSSTGCNYDF